MQTIEVFKTTISQPLEAALVVTLLQEVYPAYRVNFDLGDCDNIMRIKSTRAPIEIDPVRHLLKRLGFTIEVLENEQPLLNENQPESWLSKSL